MYTLAFIRRVPNCSSCYNAERISFRIEIEACTRNTMEEQKLSSTSSMFFMDYTYTCATMKSRTPYFWRRPRSCILTFLEKFMLELSASITRHTHSGLTTECSLSWESGPWLLINQFWTAIPRILKSAFCAEWRNG